MSDFLDMLKARLAEAQSRMAPVQAALQRAQQDHALLAQEINSWANAVGVETRREQQEGTAQSKVGLNITHGSIPNTVLIDEEGEVTEVNKTTLIRDVLLQNPNGLRPVAVWQKLQDQVPRAYVYSVLSRMKQKKQVRELRGKYYPAHPTPKAVLESKNNNVEQREDN